MIRRFLSIFIFISTILLASFGQNIFGRNDLKLWMHHIQATAPKQTEIAWEKTDMLMAQLARESQQSR